MKKRFVIILLFALGISLELHSQGELYQHPAYDISFKATPNWIVSYQDSESKGYSAVHPNHNMEISLGYVPGCKRPVRYMRRLSGLKGLVCHRGEYDTILNNQEAMVMTGNCLEGRESYSTMVIGFPTDNGLYLMEISCPEDCTPTHRARVKSILKTVRIGNSSTI